MAVVPFVVGMYTRLYRNVLNVYHTVESCNCINSSFRDSGVFGYAYLSGRCLHN